ncbi:ABC transporter permease subunit [Stieleria varia]|uniref:Ribose transport system permease protein RbsC n=1 Tax=Stieleria varia TaxID=2528005 RepID=A0A5C6ANF1_9BACT|nr:hypothetical protein [Stieleria varia]TWU01200.1 Ribose transport system permease protein RbsC [Stieleria varia]
MNKILGILGLLIFICLSTALLSEQFVSSRNISNTTNWSALFGVLSIGAAFVIITGGIDLSIGSVVGLTGCLLPMFIVDFGLPIPVTLCLVMLIAAVIGLIHGLLITRMQLQPFVVTLCGLLIYRGVARWLTDDQTLGLGSSYDDGLRLLANGKPIGWPTLILAVGVAVIAWGVWQGWRQRNSAAPDASETTSTSMTGMLGTLVTLGCGGLLVLSGMLNESSMRMIGWGIFVPAVLAFVAFGIMSQPPRMVKPLIGLAIAGVLLFVFGGKVAPMFNQISQSDTWQVGIMTVTGKWLQTLIMVSVFLAVGAFMGAAGAVLNAGATVSPTAKALLPLVVVSSMIGLLGFTELLQTRVPSTMLILIALAIAAAIFLNRTIYGRYLLAMGRNEEAAQYSGINTKRMTVLAYVICSMTAGLGGILFSLDINSVQPSEFGNFYELYAIAAAVLGGCSLRGGEGSILGVVIGAAVMRVLYNAISILGISTKLEFAIIGLVILIGVIADVMVKRVVAKRAALADAAALETERAAAAAS